MVYVGNSSLYIIKIQAADYLRISKIKENSRKTGPYNLVDLSLHSWTTSMSVPYMATPSTKRSQFQ